MNLFDTMASMEHEQVVFCSDPNSGLRSIIAVHNTTLGPGIGGVRMWPYPDEQTALNDVLRLSQGMTYKAAIAGVNFGGAKSVIIGDPARHKTEALLRAHGRFVQSLAGRYIPGVDVGTSQADMDVLAVEAKRVFSGTGDPSPLTALGVLESIRAAVEFVDGSPVLEGRRIAVQGAGHVGEPLIRHLAQEGAKLVISDVDRTKVERLAVDLPVEVVDPDDILGVDCDVFAPCALGAVVDDASIPALRCRIVAGGANNVLAEPRHAVALADAGILYVPDYVANAGGLLLYVGNWLGNDPEQTRATVLRIGCTTGEILAAARADGIDTATAAEQLAKRRIEALRHVGPPLVPQA